MALISVDSAMLTTLQTMLANGLLSSSHNGKTLTFASFDELRQRIEWIERRLATATQRPTVVYIQRRG